MTKPAPRRELLTIEEFVALSAKINYQLSSIALKKPILLSLVLGPADFRDDDLQILLGTIDVLQVGYGGDRRRLGTPGVLHPLRTTAMLARTLPEPSLMHMLGALLHDKDEDLVENRLGQERWDTMQEAYERMLQRLPDGKAEQVQRRVNLLCNRGYDSYEAYLGRLLDHVYEMPDLLHVKLADRLDNTFDIHLQHPGITKFNFYRAVFDIMFLPRFSGVDMGPFHFMPDTEEGVMLLSQLFKDLIFLALIRRENLDTLDDTTRRLFTGLAVAGIREAQWLAMEMFNTCVTDVRKQREMLEDVMRYSNSGGIASVRIEGAVGSLDGILLSIFAAQQEGTRKQMLTQLFQDSERAARMVLTFIVVFASFINDPGYTIEGIDRTGLRAP